MLTTKTNKKIGIIGFLISIVFIIFYTSIVEWITHFCKVYISRDNHIEESHLILLRYLILIAIIIAFLISLYIYFNLIKKTKIFLEKYVDLKNLKSFLFTDHLCKKKTSPFYIFIISSFIAFALQAYQLFLGTPPAEGTMESTSTLLFLISAIILLFGIRKVNNLQYNRLFKKKLKLFLIVTSIGLLFIFGEEISWGQHIFKWESFGAFDTHNFQNETNTHNFFNPLFKVIYPTFGVGFFIVLMLGWFFKSKENNDALITILMPHPSLIILAMMMLIASFNIQQEIFEEMFSVFILLYALRLINCIMNPDYNGYKNIDVTSLKK